MNEQFSQLDPQQLARLVMAARAAQQVGQGAGASPVNSPGRGASTGAFVDPQQLAQLVMAARAAQQAGQAASAAPVNSHGASVGTGPFVDPQQLAQLVRAARAAQRRAQAPGAGQQSAPALPASVLGPTSPFAAGAGAPFRPQASAPPPQPDPVNAAAIQRARQPQNRAPNQNKKGGDQPSPSPRAGRKDKPQSCPVVPEHPGYANIDDNIAESERRRAPLGVTLYFPWWYNQVKNKGPWDYKQAKKLNDFGKLDPWSPYDDFGNFNYGATGAAHGIPEQLILRGAGYAQEKSGNSNPEWGHWYPPYGPPYGDDPPGQELIKQGIQYYKNHCHQ